MQSRIAKLFPLTLLALLGITFLLPVGRAQQSGKALLPKVPKTWDEKALKGMGDACGGAESAAYAQVGEGVLRNAGGESENLSGVLSGPRA